MIFKYLDMYSLFLKFYLRFNNDSFDRISPEKNISKVVDSSNNDDRNDVF